MNPVQKEGVKFIGSTAGKIILIGVGIVVTILAIRQGKKVFDYFKSIRKNALLDTTVKVDTTQQYDVMTAAGKIAKAFYGNDAFGWTEDEDTAISVLLAVPDNAMKDLAAAYYTGSHGYLNLKADFVKYLSSSQLTKVQAKLNLI